MATELRSHDTVPTATAALTPSEQILLDAESHARPARDAGAPVLRRPGSYVDSAALAQAMLAAALLANEAAGALRLEMGIRKAWFGLSRRPEVLLHPTATQPAWPADSLEALLLQHARAQAARQRHHARDAYAALIDRDTSPELETVLRAERALRARGLTTDVEEQRTTLKVFTRTVRHPVLSAAGEAALRAHAPSTAAELLARTSRERTELWAVLTRAIRTVLAEQTISESGPDTDFAGGAD